MNTSIKRKEVRLNGGELSRERRLGGKGPLKGRSGLEWNPEKEKEEWFLKAAALRRVNPEDIRRRVHARVGPP